MLSLFWLKFFAVLGIGCLVGCLSILIRFGPETYRYLRSEYRGGFPFDRPVWFYRLRKRIVRLWHTRRAEIEAYALLIAMCVLLWLGLVIWC